MKTPLSSGDNLSPFWRMMKNIFGFTFESQNLNFSRVYSELKQNPHIPVAKFVAGNEHAMIFEFSEGDSVDTDEFPDGKNNAFRLGQYIGYNHQRTYDKYGMIGDTNRNDFLTNAFVHMEKFIMKHYAEDNAIDKKMRKVFERIKSTKFDNFHFSLIMVDICADQFLYKQNEINACVDLDAYVIGPVEWELSFLKQQVADWDRFKMGYETY